MKSIENSKTLDEKLSKMTLRGYYKSLPEAKQVAPRKNLIERVAKRCNVKFTTARSWIALGIRPRNQEFVAILSEETGIAPENLWSNN